MIISIDGNIGSGKSSGLQYLKSRWFQHGILRCFPEPVALWRNIGGTDILAESYLDGGSATCFRAQSYIMSTMAQLYSGLEIYNQSSINVVERSIFSAQKIFAQNFVNTDRISGTDFAILTQQFDLFKRVTPIPDVIIYLRCDPSVCFERVNTRGGLESGGTVSVEYLQNIHALYEQFFLVNNEQTKIRIVDSSGPIDTVHARLRRVIEDLVSTP